MAEFALSGLNMHDTSSEEFVRKSFNVFLRREPEEQSLKSYASALDNRYITRAQLCIILVDSEEFKARARSGFHIIKPPF